MVLTLVAAGTFSTALGATAAATSTTSVTGVGVGTQNAVATGSVDSAHLGAATFIQFPFAISFPSPSGGMSPPVVLVSHSENLDVASAAEQYVTQRSSDGGHTFTTLGAAVPMSTATQLSDGSLVAVDFRLVMLSPGHYESTYWRSSDYGLTWTQSAGRVSTPTPYGDLYFQRGIITAADGSLLAPMYGHLLGTPRDASVLARSVDRGATWTVISTIAAAPAVAGSEGRDEPTIARGAGGDLIAVMRQYAPINPAVCNGALQGHGLLISRSDDDGRTWSAAVPLAAEGVSASALSSADPDLMMMPSGVMVLSFGRPGNKVLLSPDGNGTTWTDLTSTMAGTSSGYTSIVSLGGDSALQFGDLGSNWCFPAGSGMRRVGIWSKTVSLRPADTGRIDLHSAYVAGAMTVSTDMNQHPTPMAGPGAPLDGSTDPGSVATAAAGSGYYQMDLKTPVVLTGASLALPHAAASADIDVSLDGIHWSTPASWYSSGQYRTLTPRGFPAGTTARYVRVRVGDAAGHAALGEVALSTNMFTFEDDLVGSAPQGLAVSPAATSMVVVAGSGAGQISDRAVHLDDTSSTAAASLTVPGSAATARTLSFAVRPVSITCALAFSIQGNAAKVALPRPLAVAVFPDGSVRWLLGTTWRPLTGPGWVRDGVWTTLSVVANRATATIYVNGHTVSRVPMQPGTTSLTSAQITSGGTKPVGDDAFIDNLALH